MLAGSAPESAWAEDAKNSYCRYFKVCTVESSMSPLYSSRMYIHWKSRVSIFLKAALDVWSSACAILSLWSASSRLKRVHSSICSRAHLNSLSRRLRISIFSLSLSWKSKNSFTGTVMLWSKSRRSLETALCGASSRMIRFVASRSLRLSEAICGSRSCASLVTIRSDRFSREPDTEPIPAVKASSCWWMFLRFSSKWLKSLTMPSNTGSTGSGVWKSRTSSSKPPVFPGVPEAMATPRRKSAQA
mmetsp:Transcript_108562/g.306997  ORF Transcript_108562/g.306997 Transcript_108562/m.306997 type:complete len:245 (+) Transcript_108562:419-1153(+)